MKKILFFMLVCSIFSCNMLYSQDSNKKLLETLVEKQVLTEDEAASILKESKEEPQAVSQTSSFDSGVKKIREAFNTPYMKFGGYGAMLYKYNQYANTHSSIKPRVVYLSLDGNLTKTLSYSILYEIIDPTLTEFYLQWSPLTFAKFRLGQYKVPFSLENQIGLAGLETIDYTRSVSSLAGMTDDVLKKQNGRNNGGRDIGVQASGSFAKLDNHNLIEYTVGVFQGAGIVSSAYNNNRSVAGSIYIQPIKGFRLGTSAVYGEATYADATSGIALGDHVRNRWAISSDYKTDRFQARAEWLHGNDGGIKREGLYGFVNYFFIPNKLGVLAKADYFNSNKDINKEVIDYTAGINYYFYKNCRFQLNYTYSDYSKKWDERNTNTVTAQMLIVF